MKLFSLASILMVGLFNVSAHAALYDRGNGMIYDDVLDITWLQDANYAASSGYAAANAVGAPNSSYTNIQADGTMGWDAAAAWASQLVYGGFDDWRLATNHTVTPNQAQSEIYGYPDLGELGYMFHHNLGNPLTDNVPGGTCALDCLNNSSFVDPDTGLTVSFDNIQNGSYWDGALWSQYGGVLFYMGGGLQGVDEKDNSNYAWSVRDGDVGAVPVPAATWLFGSAILGLVGYKRKKNSEQGDQICF